MSIGTVILKDALFECGGIFCVAVFFVYCGSIFETLSTESCIGTQLCFCAMGYASVSPSMWYPVKYGVPILIVSTAFVLCSFNDTNSVKVTLLYIILTSFSVV